jgi:hypothetical protein
MIANVLLVIGTTIFVLTALDILLSDTQKKSFSDWCTRAWNRLDDFKNATWVHPAVARLRWWSVIILFTIGVPALIVLEVFQTRSELDIFKHWFEGNSEDAVRKVILDFWEIVQLTVGLCVAVWSPFIALYAALGTLSAVELITRRVAEHPKRPMMAAGLLASATAAVIKLF